MDLHGHQIDHTYLRLQDEQLLCINMLAGNSTATLRFKSPSAREPEDMLSGSLTLATGSGKAGRTLAEANVI